MKNNANLTSLNFKIACILFQLAVSTFFENSAEDVAIPEELDVVPATTQPRMPAPQPEPQPPQQRVAPRPQPQRYTHDVMFLSLASSFQWIALNIIP